MAIIIARAMIARLVLMAMPKPVSGFSLNFLLRQARKWPCLYLARLFLTLDLKLDLSKMSEVAMPGIIA